MAFTRDLYSVDRLRYNNNIAASAIIQVLKTNEAKLASWLV